MELHLLYKTVLGIKEWPHSIFLGGAILLLSYYNRKVDIQLISAYPSYSNCIAGSAPSQGRISLLDLKIIGAASRHRPLDLRRQSSIEVIIRCQQCRGVWPIQINIRIHIWTEVRGLDLIDLPLFSNQFHPVLIVRTIKVVQLACLQQARRCLRMSPSKASGEATQISVPDAVMLLALSVSVKAPVNLFECKAYCFSPHLA